MLAADKRQRSLDLVGATAATWKSFLELRVDFQAPATRAWTPRPAIWDPHGTHDLVGLAAVLVFLAFLFHARSLSSSLASM
jgi:hypothetical protein